MASTAKALRDRCGVLIKNARERYAPRRTDAGVVAGRGAAALVASWPLTLAFRTHLVVRFSAMHLMPCGGC